VSDVQLNAPELAEFGAFLTPSGRLWNMAATPLSPGGDETNDQGCVAVAHHPSGWVALADTKIDLGDQTPLVFLPAEWRRFTEAVREGRV
jgi:hypothetical protein